MAETEITFHNKAAIRVQAQIFTGRTLVSTCVAGPGKIRTLAKARHRTGWRIASRRRPRAHVPRLEPDGPW